ncbi:MAG: DUF2892 domain-containing protein [Bacteroidia bacterium]|jgi:uncharacterized membrane protein|nr:DUF2892 domain-containing protein [Bacteroidia bacterium]
MKKNMHTIDRLLRILIAAAIVILYLTHVIGGTLATVLLIVSIIFIATSFAGFCPLYTVFRINTAGKHKPEQATGKN